MYCELCHKNKDETFFPVGLLKCFPITNRVWAEISMDFIEGLHLSHGYNVVMVVVDRGPLKYAHFIPVSHPFIAAIVANNFMQKVFKLHGLLISIISDMDAIFTSSFLLEYILTISIIVLIDMISL
jgi:hypothetical protein